MNKLKKKIALVCISSLIASNGLVSCKKQNDTSDIQKIKNEQNDFDEFNESKKLIVDISNNLLQTSKILMNYNSYLQEIGSSKRLTQEDLKIIEVNTNNGENPAILTIKLNDSEYVQVGSDYIIAATEERELLLVNYLFDLDLFTGSKLVEDNFIVLDNVWDYISANNIEPIGYTTQKYSSWSDSDADFVRTFYGDDVLECLQENGFPLPLYDVSDFYMAYQEKNVFRKIK